MRTEARPGYKFVAVTVCTSPMIIEMVERKIKKSNAATIAQVKKFAKGEKQIQARKLYKSFIANGSKGSFIDVLMTELNMTRAGARTYAYNCKKGK